MSESTESKKPIEVSFRDMEGKNLRQALEAWDENPDDESLQAHLRVAVRNYVHAQGLVEDRIKVNRIIAEMDSGIAVGKRLMETMRR